MSHQPQSLEEEKEHLLLDIEYLQHSLESEREFRLRFTESYCCYPFIGVLTGGCRRNSLLGRRAGVPSIQALRECRTYLEKQFMNTTFGSEPIVVADSLTFSARSSPILPR